MDSSVDAAHNVADPIKLILILALRTGAVQANSVDDMVTKVLNRKDRVITWAHPEWSSITTGAPGQGKR